MKSKALNTNDSRIDFSVIEKVAFRLSEQRKVFVGMELAFSYGARWMEKVLSNENFNNDAFDYNDIVDAAHELSEHRKAFKGKELGFTYGAEWMKKNFCKY